MSDPKIERVWSAQELLSWARYCREGEHDSEDGFIVQYLAKCTRLMARMTVQKLRNSSINSYAGEYDLGRDSFLEEAHAVIDAKDET